MMLHGWIGVDLDGTLATFDASDPDVVDPAAQVGFRLIVNRISKERVCSALAVPV